MARPPVIPPGVAEARAKREAGEKKKLQKHFQEEAGGAGVCLVLLLFSALPGVCCSAEGPLQHV